MISYYSFYPFTLSIIIITSKTNTAKPYISRLTAYRSSWLQIIQTGTPTSQS